MKQVETYYQKPIGHDGIWPPVPALSGYLARLDADTQERATRVLETGATAARYVVIASAYAAMQRKGRAI